MKKKLWQVFFVLVSSLAIGISLGQGCSRPYQSIHNSGDTSSSDLSSQSETPYEINPQLPTLSLIYSKQVLDHYVSCSGIGAPSDSTLSTWESKRGAVSVDGSVLTITAPMFMATTTIVGDVCRDLIEMEKVNPRLFLGVDWLSSTLTSDKEIQDGIRGLALSCWQRSEDDSERQILMDSVKSEFGMSPTNNSDAFLFLCTSMLSSIDAMIM